MFKLRWGYLITGILIGSILFVSFIWSLPDGKLRLVFCDVTQGDAAYIRFPDGRDMLVDGGPNNQVLECLGKYLPFWDRSLDLVIMTHPQNDHMYGLIQVLDRYRVNFFVKSDIGHTTESYKRLVEILEKKEVPVKSVTKGERIEIGPATLSMLWPSQEQLAKSDQFDKSGSSVLGSSSSKIELNDYSVVFVLRYGSFDVLFTGDADSRVERGYVGTRLADDTVEVLKVPHHGSKTGMTDSFVKWLRPRVSVISVGKNNYGHPADEMLRLLKEVKSETYRTDLEGDIQIVSDGKGWTVKTARKTSSPNMSD